MAYATGRTYLDADSHLMERPDFIREFADAKLREQLPPLNGGNQGKTSAAWAEVVAQPGHTPERVEKMVQLGDGLIAGPKGYRALGAFNREERSQALDQLGFAKQVVFTTFSVGQALHGKDLDLMYATAAAANRASANFGAEDPRLMGVGLLPLEDPERSIREAEHLIGLGLCVAMVPHRVCGGRSPGHDDWDPVWARLAEAQVPFALHVGGSPLQLDPVWMNTGRPVPDDWQGGGENVRGKDMIALHQPAELFLGAMMFDGVFERHRALRGLVAELGAGWVPGWLRRLDWASRIWKKEPELGALTRLPSEMACEQLGFAPFVYEDVGQLIRESNDSLYLFSSDYPHYEGSKNPIERFEALLDAASEKSRNRFYEDNFRRVFPGIG
ncbi:MAG: amidohydrolase family protein [Myxococcales bacterium]|nr:amidohydrolase family protein [Myxococcales bacterium]